MSPTRNKAIWLIIFLFLIKTTIVFGSEMDHSGDGWGYACEILKHNFLSGHHLLYNITGFIWLQLFAWLPASPIKLLSWMNVVFSSGILFVTYMIIKRITKSDTLILSILLFLASCFGFYRYSLENETYILPLFFGIISIYYLYDLKRSNLSWIAASIACLYHQIYIFWLIPILVINIQKTRTFRSFWYSTALVLTPYFIASYIFNLNIYNIVFQDVNNGLVNNHFNIKNFLIGCINLVRSIIEIHGRIGILTLKIPEYTILGIILLPGLILVLFKLTKNTFLNIKNNFNSITKLPEFYILISTILFSFYSNGNAEFMVAIPFLIVFIAIKLFKKQPNDKFKFYLILFGIINISWNTIYYLIPNCNANINVNTRGKLKLIYSVIHRKDNTKFLSSTGYNKITSKNATDTLNASDALLESNMMDTVVFISSEAAGLYNCFDYDLIWKNQTKTTEIIFLYPGDSKSIKKHRNFTMYTDLNSDKTINRASLTEYQNIVKQEVILLDSIKSKTTIYRISKIF